MLTAMLEDQNGMYDLANVAAVKKGGTPHPELNLGFKAPTAILVLNTGAEIATLVPYDTAVAALKALRSPAPASTP
jgi:hypothetical protein